jgi:hypothetical protein
MIEKLVQEARAEIRGLESRNNNLNITVAQLQGEDTEEGKILIRGHLEELQNNRNQIQTLKARYKLKFYIHKCDWNGVNSYIPSERVSIGYDEESAANSYMLQNFTPKENKKVKYGVFQTYENNGTVHSLY